MSSSETLLKAALNRIKVRLGKKIIDSANEMAEVAEDIPEILKKEWDSFQEEILEEANRLKREENIDKTNEKKSSEKQNDQNPSIKINNLRKKINDITRKIEELN